MLCPWVVLVVGLARAEEIDRKPADSGSSRNSLEDQMIGYWAVDMEDKAMVKMMDEIAGMLASLPGAGGTDPDEAKVAARKEVAEVLRVATLEFKKGEVLIHGPDGLQKNVYTIKSQDTGIGTLELEVTKSDDTEKQPGKAVIKGDQLTFTTGTGEDMESMVLKRIDAAEFKMRQEAAAQMEADDGED